MTQVADQRPVRLRALPVEVTPWLLETPGSYFDRLCIANHIAPADLWLAMRRSESRLPLGVSPNYAGHALEVLGGIPIGRFDKSQMPSALASSRAKGQLQPRSLLCRRCARGEVVEIARHVGPICIRHRRWHDGGADLDLDGRASVLAAQRIINGALSQRGIAYRSPEGLIARELLVAWRELHPPSHAPSGEIDDFPIVARLMSRLSEPEFVRMLIHTKAGRQGHAAAIESVFTATVGGSSSPATMIEVRDRELILSGRPVRAVARTIPLGPFAESLVPRIPTIRARLLQHRNEFGHTNKYR